MTEPISRRSLLALAGSLTAGAAVAPWVIPRALFAQSPDLKALQAPDTLVLLVPGFLAQAYEAMSTFALHGFDAQVRARLGEVPVVGAKLVEAMPALRAPMPEGAAVSFHTQEQNLESLGIRFQNIAHMRDSGFSTQQGVIANGRAVAGVLTQLRAKGVRRVVIVSHSKGGLDTLEALTTNEALWNTTVVGWIAFQAPFFGSPVAGPTPESWAARNRPHAAVITGAREALLKAVPVAQALDDLAPVPRAAYMQERAAVVARLTAAVPVRSCYTQYTASPTDSLWAGASAASEVIASVFSPALLEEIAGIVVRHEQANPLDQVAAVGGAVTDAGRLIEGKVAGAIARTLRTVGLMDSFNLAIRQPNDGLVPVESTRLPGASVRELLPKADHAAPVMIAAPFHDFWTTGQRDDQTMQQAAGVVS